MPKMTGGRFLAETLRGYGVTHFFFMPVIVAQAMPDMDQVGIVRIMTHGEKAAAYMADGYARVSGRVGVCGSQSVGAVNLAAGLQDGYLGCSPMIALTGRLLQVQQQRHAYQEVDHHDPFGAVTKYNVDVNTVEELPLRLRQAFREATSGTPGPAHLDLAGIAGNEIALGEADLEVIVEEPFTQVPAFRPEADVASVRAAIEVLAQAERPVIVAGGGVTASGARAELIALAERLNIPVATSLNAKATFPYDHPLAVGVPGSYSRACANQTLAEADVVFFVGSHVGGQVTNNWQLPRIGCRIVQLDINPAELGRSFPITVGMQGDVKASLRKMVDSVTDAVPAAPTESRTRWLKRVQQFVSDWRASVAAQTTSETLPMRPEVLCKQLTNLLPDDAVLVSDTGHSGIWTGTMIDLKHPGQSYIRCAGSLGWALPAAIGAQAAVPDRPVVCFTGDGGAMYHLTELDTAARYGLNTITVVNNNAALNQERGLNENIYGGQTAGSDALWRLSDLDFVAIAESMGCLGIRVERPGELGGALEQAIAAKRPTVIDVRTDVEGIAPRAWDG